MTEQIKFTEEEQAYLDTELGKVEIAEQEEAPAEEPKEEKETPPAEEEKPEEEVEVKAEEEKAEPEAEEPKEEPRPPRRTKDDTIKGLRQDRRDLRDQVKELKQSGNARLDALEAENTAGRYPAPDPDIDPDAHREFQEQKIQTLEARETGRKETEAEQTKMDTELLELQGFVADQEDDFTEDHEDYPGAIEWGKKEYASRLMKQYGLSQADADAQTFEEIKALSVQMKGMKGSVPHVLYQQALAMGYGKAEENKEETKQPKTDELKAISDGQKAARNPKGGGSKNSGLTVEELSSMDNEGFHKHSDMNALRKMFGE